MAAGDSTARGNRKEMAPSLVRPLSPNLGQGGGATLSKPRAKRQGHLAGAPAGDPKDPLGLLAPGGPEA